MGKNWPGHFVIRNKHRLSAALNALKSAANGRTQLRTTKEWFSKASHNKAEDANLTFIVVHKNG